MIAVGVRRRKGHGQKGTDRGYEPNHHITPTRSSLPGSEFRDSIMSFGVLARILQPW